MTQTYRSLTFGGRIVSGVGEYSKMVIPGSRDLTNAPPDWPDELCRGSLNILIDEYPQGFKPPKERVGGVYKLDDQTFHCAFVIPGDLIANNELMYKGRPSSAQVWRVSLEVPEKGLSIDCWILRRMGSNVGYQIPGNVLEVVSDIHFKSEFELQDGQPVVLTMFAGERTT